MRHGLGNTKPRLLNRMFSLNRIHVLWIVLAFAAFRLDAAPNVVVFLSDDQGWGDLNSSGNHDLETPRIDSIARDGASFDRFYVCPVCSPTRAEFLTGRYHERSGVYSTSAGGERMNLDETTIADLFKAAGYRTGAFGKWHNGMQYPYHPNGRGFDEFYGFCSGHWGNYFSPMLEHNNRIVDGKGFCVDDFTNRAIEFVEQSVEAKKPFFAYLPYNTPHSPMQVPDRFWKRFADRPLEFSNQQQREPADNDNHKRCALAMCENLDWNVGRMLSRLDDLGVADDTIVVWFHDNGPNGVRWNGDMRGRKGSTDEGGVRSPLYIRWSKAISAGTIIPQVASVRDLLPTLCDLADIATDSSKPLDGVSQASRLLGKSKQPDDRIIINHWRGKVSARNQRFRLDDRGRLYDMVEDPGQRIDVTNQHPSEAKDLSRAVQEHKQDLLVDYGKDTRPFVIAHPDSDFTQIPARDGVAHGGIERSNRFPNCSYFRNWKSPDDYITWTADVGAGGTYEVVVYYAAKQAGSSFELSFDDAKLEFTLDNAHDVAELGAEHDRFHRAESYVKNFKPVSVGRITLPEGTGELTLRATSIAGDEAMEFRLLTLERVK